MNEPTKCMIDLTLINPVYGVYTVCMDREAVVRSREEDGWHLGWFYGVSVCGCGQHALPTLLWSWVQHDAPAFEEASSRTDLLMAAPPAPAPPPCPGAPSHGRPVLAPRAPVTSKAASATASSNLEVRVELFDLARTPMLAASTVPDDLDLLEL
ncbi:unnamed protein product [Urochloa humidicola]